MLLQEAEFIILNETISVVGNRTDEAIQTVIRADPDQTLVVVAHRLRTIATFENIIVMESREIVEH
jgi:ABC-type multidrug transport system fused ATPase/permease subunit